MRTINELRQYQYDYHSRMYPYLNDWRKNPYSFLKSRFYMEGSALLVYFLLKTDIKPNTVTLAYGLVGLLAGLLLSIPTSFTIFLGLLLFVTKGILDWSDGHLARERGQTSVTGALLDPYGTFLGALAFQTGLGFYVAQKSSMLFFYYLIPIIPLCYAARAHFYGMAMLFKEHLTFEKLSQYRSKDSLNNPLETEAENLGGGRFKRAYYFINNFLDDRARTVDAVCLLILIELNTGIFLSWIVFLGYLLKRLIISIISMYMVAKGNWGENQLSEKANNILKEDTNVS